VTKLQESDMDVRINCAVKNGEVSYLRVMCVSSHHG